LQSAPELGWIGRSEARCPYADASPLLTIFIIYENYCVRLTIREYLTPAGRCPFREWIEDLDVAVRARIQVRVLRFETGNLGDCKSVGGGAWEARLLFGPGYRVYFGKEGRSIILLLGGDKFTQAKDIRDARRFWSEYLGATRHGETL
jgi:putative addiction module killer protein